MPTTNSASSSPPARPAYQDVTLPVERRVADLISRMTLEEKILQMVHAAPAIERLGVPAYNWWNECLHGVARAGPATVFPQAIGLAATWNVELMGRIARTISDEARAKHHEAQRLGRPEIYAGLTFWTPNINIFRDPRWGRGQETYGEDPYLTASMGVTFVKGLQGDDPDYLKLVATPKHFAVHSGPEADRHHFDARVGEADLWETYLFAFEACVREGQAASIMGAYNRVNGEPCCASPTLLAKILRQSWGFAGYVVSDCWAIIDIYQHHRVVDTPEEAASLAVRAGCDLNCGSTYPALGRAVEYGLIDPATIDQAVTRLFTARFKLGMFDPPEQSPYAQIPYAINGAPEHQALALEAARQSLVLLKNEANLLPLPPDLKSIAVIGPNADSLYALLGNYNGTPLKFVTPLEGIRRKVSLATTVYYTPGCDLAADFPRLSPIPALFLKPQEPAAAELGLTATYYDNAGFAGTPTLSRVDPTIDFMWKNTTPLAGAWGDHFSVRWSGYLIPPLSGVYRLGANGYSSYQLYLDDTLLVEYTDVHHAAIRSQAVALEGGRFYRIRLDYLNRSLDPQVQLLWALPDADYERRALETAKRADVVILVLGLSPLLEGEEMPVAIEGFAGGDRTDLNLPAPQEALLKKIHALGKPVVLVLLNGSALSINWAAEHIPAIIEGWYPGQAGGEALAEILFGEYNPGGRLPVTFYRSVADLPPFTDYAMAGHTYRYFQGEPLFPFGYGLSYTTFAYANLRLSADSVDPAGSLTVQLEVTNSGDRAGDEVVQLYVQEGQARAGRPNKALRGFARLSLEPAETKTVSFRLAMSQLATYDETAQQFMVEPGRQVVQLGSSSAEVRLAAEFTISGRAPAGAQRAFFSQVQVE